MASDVASLARRPGAGFIFSACLMLGLIGGVGYSALDLALNAGGSLLINPLEVVLVGGLLGALAGLSAGLLISLATRCLPVSITREQLVAALLGLGLQAILVASFHTIVALMLLPVPWVLIALARRRLAHWAESPGRLAVLCSALLLLLILIAAGAVPKRIFQLNLLLTVVGLLAVLWIGRGGARPSLRRTLCLLASMLGPIAFYFVAIQLGANSSNKAHAAKKRTGLPNVVLIVLDTTRADHLGCYGDPRGLTPNLDRLAAEGTLYENAISPSPWTVPSHASMFTGYYPVTHGASSEHMWLDDGFVTLAEMLKADGYQTVSLASNILIAAANLNQGFDHQVPLYDSYERLRLYRLARYIGLPQKWVDKGALEAAGALRSWFEEAYDQQRPFFLFVNLMEAHELYLPPLPQRAAYLPSGVSYRQATALAEEFSDMTALKWQVGRGANKMLRDAIRGLYAAGVAYQDEKLGKLLEALRAHADLDETLVIVTADHGENLGEANRWGHLFALNDYLLRVPLIIRYPRLFPAGRRQAGQCQLVDIVPTIFDVLGRNVPIANLPGRSLVPSRFAAREYTFAQFSPHYPLLGEALTFDRRRNIADLAAHYRVIRTESYKYVWSSSGNNMLHDLRHDPDEAANVIGEHPEVARSLDRHLAEWWQQQPPYLAKRDVGSGPPKTLTPAEIERLRSLGYIR